MQPVDRKPTIAELWANLEHAMKCLHKHCTLCGEYGREAETFVGWQCDDCGMMLWALEVSEDELYRAGLPAIDQAASEAAIRALGDRADPKRTEVPAMQFLAGAVRR